ncbi:MAG: RrF2 family transcriptional regulator [Cytophagaceae bacterium]
MLTKKSKYGLKAMIYLASKENLVHISELSGKENIPQKFLETILLELKKHGLLESRRGPNGGYIMGKPASEITFGQIIRILDGPLAPIPCVSEMAYKRCDECEDEATCLVRKTMKKVRDRTAYILDNTTLAQSFNLEEYEKSFL